MKYIKGQNRSQTCLFPVSLDDGIGADNEVRLIDVFVDSLALERLRKYLEELIDLILCKTGLVDHIPAHILAFFEKWKNWKVNFILPIYRLTLINISQSNAGF